ncbi:MAG: hypothetical protein RR398_05290 [Clostridia bacterium]
MKQTLFFVLTLGLLMLAGCAGQNANIQIVSRPSASKESSKPGTNPTEKAMAALDEKSADENGYEREIIFRYGERTVACFLTNVAIGTEFSIFIY